MFRTHPTQPQVNHYVVKVLWSSIMISMILVFISVMSIGFVGHYQGKYRYAQQLAQLLAQGAASSHEIQLVSKQVDQLLATEPSFSSITFYSTDYLIDHKNSKHSWVTEAFIADSISISQPVISEQFHDQVMVGYINIRIDMNTLRHAWLRKYSPLWLLVFMLFIAVGVVSYRRLRRPLKQINELTRVADLICEDDQLSKLPVFNQDMDFADTQRIQQALSLLFAHVREVEKQHHMLQSFQQQLQLKDKSLDMQRSSFQSMITHELKTSLNAIFGGLQLLAEQRLNHEQKDAVSIISKGSQQLSNTLEQIIDLNKMAQGQLLLSSDMLQPRQMIAQWIAKFEPRAKSKSLQLNSHILHGIEQLEGDADKINRIVSVLLDNAIKFTHQGSITIESDIKKLEQQTHWQIRIIDTGVGIEQQYLQDIFDPFFQIDPSINREYEGIGVGLTLAKQLTQMLGGELSVTSQIDLGSCFSLCVPLLSSEQQQQRRLLMDQRVLVCHRSMVSELDLNLASYGAQVHNADTAQEVPQYLAEQDYDALFIADSIPITTVQQLVEPLRQQPSDRRMVIVYYYNQNKHPSLDVVSMQAYGVDYCLSTEVVGIDLVRQLSQWLR